MGCSWINLFAISGPTAGSPRADGFLCWPRRPHHLWPGRGGLRVEVRPPPGTEAGLAWRPGVGQPADDGLRLQVQPGLGLQRPGSRHRPQPQPFPQRGHLVQADYGSGAGQLRSLPSQVGYIKCDLEQGSKHLHKCHPSSFTYLSFSCASGWSGLNIDICFSCLFNHVFTVYSDTRMEYSSSDPAVVKCVTTSCPSPLTARLFMHKSSG